MTERRTARALGLISGGLDSMLAARLLMEQGVAVVGIAFTTPFFGSANAEAAARRVGFPLIVRDITAAHLAIVKDPPSGYGSQMNPCIDCHALMLRVAGEVMDAEGFDFVFTGEVLNERRCRRAGARSAGREPLRTPGACCTRCQHCRWTRRSRRRGLVDRSRLLDLEGARPPAVRWPRSGIADYLGRRLPADRPELLSPAPDLLVHGRDRRTFRAARIGRQFRTRQRQASVGRTTPTIARSALRDPATCSCLPAAIPGPAVVPDPTRRTSRRSRYLRRYSDSRAGECGSPPWRRGTAALAEPISDAELVAPWRLRPGRLFRPGGVLWSGGGYSPPESGLTGAREAGRRLRRPARRRDGARLVSRGGQNWGVTGEEIEDGRRRRSRD
jgi:hypothetical protein